MTYEFNNFFDENDSVQPNPPQNAFRFKKSFIADCLNGDASPSDVDKYVDYWHTHNTKTSLQTFLGMTDEEFEQYGTSSDSVIENIIKHRQSSTAINEGGTEMTQEQYLKELDKILTEIDFLSIHFSPDFQCDQTDGFPVSLCVSWEKQKAWLEPNKSLSADTDEKLMQKVMDQIADYGIRDCESVEDFNNLLKGLGDDAYRSAYLYPEEESEMGLCQS